VSVDTASEYIFGYVLMNDWSARDIQRFEYVPLGPFLGKNFGTTISPWVIPSDSLKTIEEAVQPGTAEYLKPKSGKIRKIDEPLTVEINGQAVTRSNTKHLYWSFEQMIAHHTINGCNLQVGDLLGSGTISGPDEASLGSLLELTRNKTKPIMDGSRIYLEDGDVVSMKSELLGDDTDCVGKIVG
jgi:fumarylacetoacetase